MRPGREKGGTSRETLLVHSRDSKREGEVVVGNDWESQITTGHESRSRESEEDDIEDPGLAKKDVRDDGVCKRGILIVERA